MCVKFKATYDRNHDTFRVEFLLAPCAVLALLINHEFTIMEILWTFSIYLEAVAILPQLFMVSKTGELLAMELDQCKPNVNENPLILLITEWT